ncbi:MAG TPA: twin-arginine translocase TatA/TatE family subunit [Bacillota bacterium]|jgi:TatA/E family protein of Tat protein translocase|nr:twin-arginine translocase TatA/TatE family subunit [Peptococcaceae bacterium MAG4]HPZ43277.1 twin-arginine translocase TatA/TatE family subunit [Bacillota bacterium]HQD75864.1 twin-arginine translocase TatA/TatE family subunit [Bacillota bacterium]HUM57775.1 twin-arginine translocase TatA/TatE family subunit [Bacillota bacterium]
MMPHIGATELILVLVLALIIFGPGKLPDLGKAVGKTISEFRRSSREIMEDASTETNEAQKEGSQVAKAVKS